jgi:hypothetical protein
VCNWKINVCLVLIHQYCLPKSRGFTTGRPVDKGLPLSTRLLISETKSTAVITSDLSMQYVCFSRHHADESVPPAPHDKRPASIRARLVLATT